MLDLHCHILFDVDDGAPDIETSVEMARLLHAAGFRKIAASPHYGIGPGGDVPLALADERRGLLQERLQQEGVELQILANAEHHVTPELYDRVRKGEVVPIGGAGHWLLVELPWQGIVDTEGVLFRLQIMGYRLLLAHPERYQFLEFDVCQRLVERGVKLQLELGSFVGVYGKRAEDRAAALFKANLGHVLASDLHRPKQGEIWLAESLDFVRKRYGQAALHQGTHVNPEAMLADASGDSIEPMTGSA